MVNVAAKLRMGLGCNSLGHITQSQGRQLLHTALDCGVEVFDTAAVYASGEAESELGRWLPHDRSQLFVITKFGHPQEAGLDGPPGRSANIIRSAEQSLRRLQTDVIDCLVMHFPDDATPIEESLYALQRLMEQGKITSYGLSNFSKRALSVAIAVARQMKMPTPLLVQEEYSLLNRERAEAILPLVMAHDIPLTPYFPLASGLLTGAYRHGTPQDSMRARVVRDFNKRFLQNATLECLRPLYDLSDRSGIPLNAIAFHWLRHQAGIGAIPAGASSSEQVRENARAWATNLSVDVLDEAAALFGARPSDRSRLD